MSSTKPIIAFEFSRLSIGDQGFTEHHFNALVKYNDLHKGKYFNVGHRKIIFKSYVGVIQTGNEIIEVLPKADKYPGNEDVAKWQNALLYMLRNAGFIRLNQMDPASLSIKKTNLMDVYLYTFLKEVEQLVHAGLTKKYRRVANNRTSLNGRLLIEKQILFNTIHKERFFTEHTVYDIDNMLNRILKTALEIIRFTSLNTSIKQETAKLLLYFEGICSWQGKELTFQKIVYNRKTSPYRHPIELAKMIIFNYNPAMKSGGQFTMALLFDMNLLFEKFIFKMLKRREGDFRENELLVTAQNSQLFWENKTIRPDILLNFKRKGSKKSVRVIIDTKWKIVSEGYPSDSDLKQMFAYTVQFDAKHAILLYPSAGQKNHGEKEYAKGSKSFDFQHSCEMYFITIFNKANEINTEFADLLLNYLIT